MASTHTDISIQQRTSDICGRDLSLHSYVNVQCSLNYGGELSRRKRAWTWARIFRLIPTMPHINPWDNVIYPSVSRRLFTPTSHHQHIYTLHKHWDVPRFCLTHRQAMRSFNSNAMSIKRLVNFFPSIVTFKSCNLQSNVNQGHNIVDV